MSASEAHGPDTEHRRLEILLADYEQGRDDDRTFTNVMTALASVATALLAALTVLLQQTCILNGNRGQCWEMSQSLLAAVPIVPLACFALLQALGQVSVVRSYYLRALEVEIQTYSIRPLQALVDVRPASYSSIVNEITSLRSGRRGFRILVGVMLLAVFLVFGGFTLYIATRLTEVVPRIAMAVVYVPLIALIVSELLTIIFNGRSFFRSLCESYVARRLHEPVPELGPLASPKSSRSLHLYLLAPRPEEAAKAGIAPAVLLFLLLFSNATGEIGAFFVLWLCFELLVYPARYQWNDIRGYADDVDHPERAHKRRLPFTATTAEQNNIINVSSAIILIRLAVAALIGFKVGLGVEMSILIATTIGIAGLYETLKSNERLASAAPPVVRAHLIWVAVSFGYVVRSAIGVLATDLALPGVYSQVLVWAVGAWAVMVVLLIWTLDGASHCRSVETGTAWQAPTSLRRDKPQLAELLPSVANPPVFVAQLTPGDDEGAKWPALRRRGNLVAPWNAYGLAAVLSLTWTTVTIPGRPEFDFFTRLTAFVFIAALFATLASRDTTMQRCSVVAAIGAVGFIALLVDSEYLRLTLPLLAVSVSYTALRHTTYREIQIGPSKAIVQARSLALAAARAFIGKRTWERLH